MNNVTLIGRFTKDPTSNSGDITVTKFTLAVDRRTKDGGADFIPCVTFGKTAEFVSKYCVQGTKIAVEGRIQTGNYTNKEGQKVYTTDVVVNNVEFAESKKTDSDGFMKVDDTDLPFN